MDITETLFTLEGVLTKFERHRDFDEGSILVLIGMIWGVIDHAQIHGIDTSECSAGPLMSQSLSRTVAGLIRKGHNLHNDDEIENFVDTVTKILGLVSKSCTALDEDGHGQWSCQKWNEFTDSLEE
jgi:hypothetical protein